MKDYKYLASNETPPDDSPQKASASYTARPAWRNQWWQIGVMCLMPVVFAAAMFWGERYFSAPNLRVVLVVTVAVFVYLMAMIVYRRYSWRYLIDGETIESREGIIARKVRSIRIRDLRNINVNQSLMQRLLHLGSVEFSSSAGSDVEVAFFGVSHPMQIKAQVQRLQNH
ncbi:MAG: PH domain-containing protein [Sulfuricaulis sp.]